MSVSRRCMFLAVKVPFSLHGEKCLLDLCRAMWCGADNMAEKDTKKERWRL
jgi:hypothetical protein